MGIGADATLFSVANGLVLRPPVADAPERIVNVHAASTDGSGFHAFSYLDAVDLQRDDGLDDGTVIVSPWSMDMVSLSIPSEDGLSAGEARVAGGQLVGPRYWDVFGLPPAAGRYFDEELLRQDSDVVVISHRLARELADAPAKDLSTSIGRTVRINQRSLTVVGVAAEGFTGPFGAVATSAWMPMELQPLVKPRIQMDARGSVWLEMVARLGDDMDQSRAEAYLDARFTQLIKEYPESHAGDAGVHLSPLGHVPGQAQSGLKIFLTVLMAAVSLLLLVTCFDVAGMLLSRATERRREIAVRLALGAGRMRLARQMITENLLLFVLGGGAGLLLAHWATSTCPTRGATIRRWRCWYATDPARRPRPPPRCVAPFANSTATCP